MTASAAASPTPLTRSILVTDSGLGGLSVFNAIANQLQQGSPWHTVKLTYFNAWPAPHRGYNHFDTKEKRARIFNNALNVMGDYSPDLILIACNTLSVIYPHTEFARSTDIQVDGIVDHGVQMLYENLAADSDSMAVILGTPTTIAANRHQNDLVQRGIAKSRIIPMGCTNLAGWIEREPFSMTVDEMIRDCVHDACTKLENFSGNVYVALCCTHFGYRQKLFEAAFAESIKAKVTLLNPNVRMAEQVFASGNPSRLFPTTVKMKIVSKAVWSEAQVSAYLKLLPQISTATRNALLNYTLDQKLFTVD